MVCEECMGKMTRFIDAEHGTQGWRCAVCGWSVVTTYIEDIYCDATEYSLYIKNVSEIDIEKIRLVAKFAHVNFLTAKELLEKEEVCILKAQAPEMKDAVSKLQDQDIEFYVDPLFKY